MTVADFDDFVLWVTLGIILGGRIGYVLFYNPRLFRRASARDLPALEGRHVVPRRLPRLRARGRAVRAPPRPVDSLARRRHLRGRDRSGCSSAASPISSTASCGAGRPTCRGRWCFPSGGPLPRHPSQLYEAALEGLVLFVVLALLIRAGALKRPGLRHRRVRARLRHRALDLRILPRARCAARLPLGRAHHGHAAVAAADARRHRLHCGGRATPDAQRPT